MRCLVAIVEAGAGANTCREAQRRSCPAFGMSTRDVEAESKRSATSISKSVGES